MPRIKMDLIVPPVNVKYGAPMGRPNIGKQPVTRTRGRAGRICKVDQTKVYDHYVPMSEPGYDKGGAYWGIGRPLRVRYTKDLSYVEFYRMP